MTRDRWQRIDELMGRARELPAGERAEFLDEACGDDAELRHELESLLAFDGCTAFFDEPAFNIHDEDPDLGRRLGPYEIVRLLGRGGMGKVYLARRRDDYDQKVAVKLIRPGFDSAEILRRFRNERQILADLEHPHIARLLDGGTTTDGLPYFVMEYVEGEPIDRYCGRRNLSLRKRLELFRQICSAVQVSHQKLIVHRDLKPGNILVTNDGGVPKLLDFGIAKMLEPDQASAGLATLPGHRPMTLKYASPEQIVGEAVTTASDTYSLGVLLFQLLTGLHPYDPEEPGETVSNREILIRACQQEPPKPSTAVRRHRTGPTDGRASEPIGRARGPGRRKLARRLTGDLDAIVLKALRKEPELRYGSVEQFSEDVRRHLAGLPVIARRGTFAYRAGKFVRRNRLGLVVAAVILAASVFATVQWREAVRERERADQAFQFLVDLFETSDPDAAGGEDLTARDMLERGRHQLADVLNDDPRLWTTLVDTLGRIDRKLGLYDEALELMEDSLRGLRQHVPGDDPEIAKRLNNIADLHYHLGNPAQAENFLREALAMLQRLGLKDADTVNYLNNLATILASRGELEEAEEIYRRGLELRIATDGCEHPRVAKSFRSLGNLLYLQGDLEEAERYLRRALELRRQAHGPDHTEVAKVADKLGEVLAARGRDQEAESQYRHALAIWREILGENLGETARTKRKLAALLLARGDLEEGKALLDQALATFEEVKSLPEEDWEVAETRGLQGVYLMKIGRHEEAETLLTASYETIRKASGDGVIYSRIALGRLLELYEILGDGERLADYRELERLRHPPQTSTTKQPGKDPGCLSVEK